jgi:hypothetical protein
MKDLIFEHFVPIVWEPGHMGAFLANFLTPKITGPIPLSEQGGMLSNKEWLFNDAFNNFFATHNNHDQIRERLSKNYSGIELIEMMAIAVVDRKYNILTKESGPELTFEKLKNNSSRYLKEHPYQKRPFEFDKVVWKNKKIYCRFPYNKVWIPYFLLKYKFGFYDPEFREITKSLNKHSKNPYPDLRPLSTNYNDYLIFDIYDLIFNKNIDQIYDIDPTFEFNDDKKAMLELAHTTSIEILNLFGLDHNWSIDHTTKTEDILNKPTKHSGFIRGRVLK